MIVKIVEAALLLTLAAMFMPQVSSKGRPHMFRRTCKRIFKWASLRRKYQKARKLSDHRATNLAVKLTLNGSLTPCRAISSFTEQIKN